MYADEIALAIAEAVDPDNPDAGERARLMAEIMMSNEDDQEEAGTPPAIETDGD